MPSNEDSHLSQFSLNLNGKLAAKDVLKDLLDCTIENSLHLPDVCTLRFHDTDFHWLDSDTLKEGTQVEVQGGEEDAALTSLFHGEVTALEMDLVASGTPTLVLRCYDRSHRLHRGRNCRTFVQAKDTDILKKVAEEEGYTAHTDETSQVHEWIFQNNQTNWEFLTERAAHNGYRLYVQGEKELHFHKVKDAGDGTISLEWGKNLRTFRPRTTAAGQVDEVTVRGWDPKTKQPIIGRSAVPAGTPQIGDAQHGGDVAQKAFGKAKMLVADHPVHTQAEANDLARSVCDDIGGGFVEAEGLAYGQPALKPGMTVEIKNIGKRFSGKYQVTATTHVYTPSDGYSTLFSISGKTPSTLLGLLHDQGKGARASLGGSIVIGVVTDNKDPDNLGRVKVKYPWLTDDHTSHWARQSSPMAGGGRGFYFLPEVDDEVLVAFEHGDVRRAYIIGSLWNGKDTPIEGNDKAIAGGKVNRRTIKSRIGHTVLLDDTDGKGEMRLTTAGGHTLTLDDKNKNITVQTTRGHKLVLDDAGDKIELADRLGANTMTIHTPDNSISLNCLGNFSVNAVGSISLTTAQQFEVTAAMGMTMTTPAAMTQTVGLAMTTNVGAAWNASVGAVMTVNVGGAYALSSAGALAFTAGAATAITSSATLALTGATIPITGVVLVNGLPLP